MFSKTAERFGRLLFKIKHLPVLNLFREFVLDRISMPLQGPEDCSIFAMSLAMSLCHQLLGHETDSVRDSFSGIMAKQIGTRRTIPGFVANYIRLLPSIYVCTISKSRSGRLYCIANA